MAAPAPAGAAPPQAEAERDEELEDFAVASSDEEAEGEPTLDVDMVNELLLVCSNLGMLRVPAEGGAPVLLRGENCINWVHDLQRAVRRDHAKHRLVAKQLGQWKILQKKLLPLLLNHQHDWALVFSILKVLVMLTMKPPRDSTNVAQQLKYLRQYKNEFLRRDVVPVLMTILVDPLSRKGSARTQQDFLNMEIVLTLLRNLLAIPNEDPRFVTSTTAFFSRLQEDLICTLHEENVYEMLLLFAQDIDSPDNREWNLLIMEMLDLTLDCSQPKHVVAYAKKQLAGEGVATTTASRSGRNVAPAGGNLLAKLNSEKKASALHQSGSRRHSNFGGVLTMVGATGRTTVLSDFSKTVYDQVPQAAKKPVSRRRGKKSAAPVTDIQEIFGGKGRVTESDERTMLVLQEICDSIVSKSYFQLTTSLKTEFRRGSNKLISTDRLEYFHLVWYLTTYHRLKVQALKSHYKHQLKAVQKKTAELQNALDFTTPPPPPPEKPDYDEKAVLSTLDMFSFNFVLQSIENYATMKNYHGMTVSVQLLAEMMAYLAELTTSDDPRFQRIADSLQHKIFYERDFLDRLPVLLKTWSPGLFPKAYVVDVVTLTHLVFKVLDSQGNIKVLSRRKAYLDKRRQKKKNRADGASKDGEDSEDSSTDEEETERQAQLLLEMQRKEADFDVRKYFSSMVSADTIRMYCSLLADYRENSAKVNHYIHAFFYRTSHFKVYQQEQWTMQPMLFNIHVLLLFNKMLQDAYIQRLPEYKGFLEFIRGAVRDFFTLADKNNLLFVEALLRQTYPSRTCMLIQRSYDPIDSMSKSKSEAVALGREKRIEALNESRRHRIALDHEELEGEAEFEFSLEPSDFQSTSLVDKEGDEDEAAATSAAKPKPKRKAAMSRAATERAKNWSKVEDRYLAKVFMKYRHLPSVYEVISYEDMFQERDRTPQQIERRVKYLKLASKTHDSSDEDEQKSNSEDEQEGVIPDNTGTVRVSRLEEDLAELDVARPRRRLRRGADLSDDESDEDMLLGGSPSAAADASQSAGTASASANDEAVGASDAVPDEMHDASPTIDTSEAPSEKHRDSQSQDMEETQVLEDSRSEEQSSETQATRELEAAAGRDPSTTSAAPSEAPTPMDIGDDAAVATETAPPVVEAVPEENPADAPSLKRARAAEDDVEMGEETPAKKVIRAEGEELAADASASQQ